VEVDGELVDELVAHEVHRSGRNAKAITDRRGLHWLGAQPQPASAAVRIT
jgi:hypothetical protein